MDIPTSWTTEPHAAYLDWQATDAAGADRRRFSQQSIIQHKAMFDRFLRHLSQRPTTLAEFGPEHLESFFADVDNRCAPDTTTRLRYTKLIDRLCRHLVDVGMRQSNPAAIFALTAAWPDEEPEPLFLDPAKDMALQAHVQRSQAATPASPATGLLSRFSSAQVSLAAELRATRVNHAFLDGVRPHLYIPKSGRRLERIVALPAFCTPALCGWQWHHPAVPEALLFPAPRTTDSRPMMSFWVQ
ncbi:site-specific integrase [Paraburkholderia sediminicola]|uniref:site-specific integrase n=1 Tax=Paraburkholderia sediminicola TaxID=458836 RepID=UPI0038BC0FEA